MIFKYVREVKAIVESFEGSWLLIAQAKVCLQAPVFAVQLLKIREDHKCMIRLAETLEGSKNMVKAAVKAIQKLDFGEDTALNVSLTNYIFKNKEGPQASVAFLESFSLLQKFSAKDRNFRV